MKILPDTYYDFQDVLLRPKRSRISSRSQVDLERTITFLHSGRTWTGVPIMTSNMDTTGTFEMYYELVKHKMITVFHKHYDIEDYPLDLDPNYYSLSTGISDKDWEKTQALIQKLDPYFLTIDVANGYNEKFVEFCLKVRGHYPNLTIFAGNVVTQEMVQELLITAKVDVVKCGIGSGCLVGNTLVVMHDFSEKEIKNIEVGDMVMGINMVPIKVLNKWNKGKRKLVEVNTHDYSIKCTKDHKFYIPRDGTWKEAKDLTNKDHLLTCMTSTYDTNLTSQVTEVKFLEEIEVVWDIEVDSPDHSFFANGVAVHNSVCSTRIKTGVGMPQLSANLECAEAANGLDGHIISDGGCVNPGDVAKAFASGAHFVMLGSVLSGHEESGGETIVENGQKFKLFYGMSSQHAQDKHHGGMSHYRSSEGKVKKIPYKGPVEETIRDILGGIRSTGTYIGACRLKDFPKCATFIKVNRQVNQVYDHPIHSV